MSSSTSTSTSTSASNAAQIQSQFSQIANTFEAERAVREQVSDQVKILDNLSRTDSSSLELIHSVPWTEKQQYQALRTSHLAALEQFIAQYSTLQDLFRQKGSNVWKFRDSWSMTLQRQVTSLVLSKFIFHGILLTKEEALVALRQTQVDEPFKITTEEYLHALLSMCNELGRLSINCVTMGDFFTPSRIAKLVKDLQSGFSLLNLKNDSLRRRFDALKYDVKKTEEVVYDLSLRRLMPENLEGGLGSKAMSSD